MKIASIRLDGLLMPTQFDELPNSSRSNLGLNGLTLRQIPGDRRLGETELLFAMLGQDQITLDISMDFESTKNRMPKLERCIGAIGFQPAGYAGQFHHGHDQK